MVCVTFIVINPQSDAGSTRWHETATPGTTGKTTSAVVHPPALEAGVITGRTAPRDSFIQKIAELCNGSTYDSDSYCLGSNPSSAAKKSPRRFGGFFVPRGEPGQFISRSTLSASLNQGPAPLRYGLLRAPKKKSPLGPKREGVLLLIAVPGLRLKAIAAINRLIVGGPERNHGVPATLSAHCGIHFPIAAALLILPCSPACRATLGLIGEALFSEEVLFALGEYEIGAAVPASKCLVCQNKCTSVL